MRSIGLALVSIFMILLLVPLLAIGSWVMLSVRMMGAGMMGRYSSMQSFGWGPMIIGGLGFLLFLGLIVVGVYYLLSGPRVTRSGEDRSLDILRERFAKGEITEEQFQKMKKQLQD